MLDKEVVKFTRDGIQKQNLATGDQEMLTKSDYAREIKYHSHNTETAYQPSKSTGQSYEKAQCYKKGQSESRSRTSSGSSSTQSTGYPNGYSYGYGTGNQQKSGNSYKDQDVKYYYSAKVTGDKIQTHADLHKGRLKRIRKKTLHSAVNSVSRDIKESDNAGLEAIGQSVQTISHTRSGVSRLKKAWRRDSITPTSASIHNTEYAAAKNASEWKAAYKSQNAARKTARKEKEIESAAKQMGKAVIEAVKAAINPTTLKYLAIAAAIVIGIVLIIEMYSSVLTMFVGSTTEHPELTAYVEQLDREFLARIDSMKEDYEKDKNNKVNIEGDEQVNTDANTLAILASGEWTSIKLTPENKSKLSACHRILNTYSVSKTDEKVKEQSSTSSGSTSQTTKTIHHITIRVQVYTAAEKMDEFGFTAAQKKNVGEMLELLNEITNEIGGLADQSQSGSIPSGNGAFIWPVPGHTRISSGYGTRVDPITGKESAFHTGLDIPAPTGTSVLASADGTVIRAGLNSGFGNCVIIQHKNGLQTLYGHNSELVVKKGDIVKQGQVIAKAGSTGRSTGPHCHFEFRISGRHIDPEPYLKGVSKK